MKKEEKKLEILEKLKTHLEKALEKREVIVDEIYIKKQGKYTFLTIVLDKVGGIDLDEIVASTEIINPIVDEYDICDSEYILDVISEERGGK